MLTCILCVGLPFEEAKRLHYYLHFREEGPDNERSSSQKVGRLCGLNVCMEEHSHVYEVFTHDPAPTNRVSCSQ